MAYGPHTADSRSAIARAYYFLEKAENFTSTQIDDSEAHLEAAVIFGRTALHRLQTKYENRPGWKAWWDSLLADASVDFFRRERNVILKEGPSKFGRNAWAGGIGGAGGIGEGGAGGIGGAPALAKYFYYYDDYQTPATETVRKHLPVIARYVRDAEKKFGQPAS